MTKEEFWKKFKNGVLYIHTPTEEQCQAIAKMSKENGIYLNLDMTEYYRHGKNTYLGVVKKDDLDIILRVVVEIHMGESIDSWLAYGNEEAPGNCQTVEYSEVFGEEVKEDESDLNIKAMLACKIYENNSFCVEACGECVNILICLKRLVVALKEEGIPKHLINMAVEDGIKHAKKGD